MNPRQQARQVVTAWFDDRGWPDRVPLAVVESGAEGGFVGYTGNPASVWLQAHFGGGEVPHHVTAVAWSLRGGVLEISAGMRGSPEIDGVPTDSGLLDRALKFDVKTGEAVR